MRRRKIALRRRVEVLTRVREILATPHAWTRGSWRKTNTSGRGYGGESFCLLGACQQAYFEVYGKRDSGDGGQLAEELSLATLARAKNGNLFSTPTNAVVTFNDKKGRTKAEVIALVDERLAELS